MSDAHAHPLFDSGHTTAELDDNTRTPRECLRLLAVTAPTPAGSTLHVHRSGRGPRLVLVHGFTQTSRSWGPIVDDLGTDHELVLVDAPGHGGSGAVVADLGAAARLVGEAGGRACYVGYSMGGRIALHLALETPDLVDRLVLVSATAGIDDPAERARRREADEALAARIEQIGVERFIDEWLAQPLFAGVDAGTLARAERLANTAEGLASSLRHAGTGTQEPLWERLGSLEMPVLVMAGDHDAKFTALARRTAAAIGANATLSVVPAAGHSVHLEAPEAFIAVLRSWLGVTQR